MKTILLLAITLISNVLSMEDSPQTPPSARVKTMTAKEALDSLSVIFDHALPNPELKEAVNQTIIALVSQKKMDVGMVDKIAGILHKVFYNTDSKVKIDYLSLLNQLLQDDVEVDRGS